MDKSKFKSTALGGLTNNPAFVLVLGMCPTLATSKTFMSALGMGIATTAVLLMTNVLISLCRKFITDKVRIPCYVLIIATMTTVVDMLIKKFIPGLHGILGIFIPLIVVNCIIFARAESFASANKVGYAAVDGLSMGLGFTAALMILGFIRELLTYGNIKFTFEAVARTKHNLTGSEFLFGIFAQPIGAFIMLALLMAAFNAVYKAVKGASVDRQNELMKSQTITRPENADKGVTA